MLRLRRTFLTEPYPSSTSHRKKHRSTSNNQDSKFPLRKYLLLRKFCREGRVRFRSAREAVLEARRHRKTDLPNIVACSTSKANILYRFSMTRCRMRSTPHIATQPSPMLYFSYQEN